MLDSGDICIAGKEHAKLQRDALIKGHQLMKYDALNVGEGELSFGLDQFKEIVKNSTLAFVSCNISVENSQAGSPFLPYVVKKMDGIRVAVTGVANTVFFNEEMLNKEKIKVNSPVESLKRILPELKQRADVIILLSHLGYDGTKNLIQNAAPGDIDVAVVGHGLNILNEPEKINNTVIIQNSMKGEYLGLLNLTISIADLSVKDYGGRLIPLTDDHPEHKEALKVMTEYTEAIAKYSGAKIR